MTDGPHRKWCIFYVSNGKQHIPPEYFWCAHWQRTEINYFLPKLIDLVIAKSNDFKINEDGDEK
jgi:hypothetical protein